MTSYYDESYPNPCKGITTPAASDPRDSDYFRGYVATMPHPMMTSTGSEGRCDICSGYSDDVRHRKPWFRPSIKEYLRLQAARRIPLERPPSESVHDLSYDARQARIDAIIPSTKEVPTTMRIALTVEVPDLMAYAKLINLIQDEGKANVITANMAPTPEAQEASRVIRRRIATTPTDIRALVDSALARSETPEIEIQYRSQGDLTPTTRRILPLRWERSGNLGAIDVVSGGYKQYVVESSRFKRAEIL